ncbi:MAG TPA: cyclase family protein [Bryobacteraceae bacterium]|nr:cyclase family protein [Bryobacteraceae bacterium]
MKRFAEVLKGAKVYDLAQPYYVGMPHYPSHPPYLFGLVKKHGDFVGPAGHSSAADAISLGSHVGTHIDALCHFSCCGRIFGGEEVAPVQSYGSGVGRLSVDTVAPILRRGVLLDVAGLVGAKALAVDFEVTPEHLEDAAQAAGVEIERGDIVLLRTGWGAFWDDAARFISNASCPGAGIAAARWLSERGVFAVGADTVGFERLPDPAMPVHVHLLVESGIHIIECLNLEEAAAARLSTFLFVAAPLKLRGATGSPIRPVAVV